MSVSDVLCVSRIISRYAVCVYLPVGTGYRFQHSPPPEVPPPKMFKNATPRDAHTPMVTEGRITPLIVDSPELAAVLPATFLHGYASASYQIEGGHQTDGRGPSIWDEKLKEMENGDEAVNSYGLWKEDVELLRKYGATGYRFSVSWSRVIPLGELLSISAAYKAELNRRER